MIVSDRVSGGLRSYFLNLKTICFTIVLFNQIAMQVILQTVTTFPGDENCDSTYYGISSHYLGDINGDGYGDIAMTNRVDRYLGRNPNNCPFRFDVFFGGPDFDSIPDFIIEKQTETFFNPLIQEFGRAIGTNGDINGDGVNDIVFGDHLGFHILLGGAEIDTVFDLFISEYYNCAVSLQSPTKILLGDLNNDGYDDIITSNSHHNVDANWQYPDNGIVRFYPGDANLDINLGWVYVPDSTDWSVDCKEICDINGDAIDDLLINENHWEGNTDLFLGGTNVDSIPDLTLNYSGPLSSGDINNDGFDDIYFEYTEPDYIIWGSSNLSNLNVQEIVWEEESNHYGFPILYDMNNDDYDDFVIYYDYDTWGKIFVFLGGITPDTTVAAERVGQHGGYFGISKAGVGDINADGVPDLLVGEPEYPIGYDDYGRGFLLAGDTTLVALDVQDDIKVPTSFSVSDPYPNPFNGNISFDVFNQLNTAITVSVYDVTGHKILWLEPIPDWSNKQHSTVRTNLFTELQLSSGIYLIHFQNGRDSIIRKITFIK